MTGGGEQVARPALMTNVKHVAEFTSRDLDVKAFDDIHVSVSWKAGEI